MGFYDSGSYLEGTTVEYGGGNGYGCLFSYYSDPELNGVTAQSCDNAGFYVYSGSYPLVYDSTFQDNAIYGVYVLDSAGLDSSGGPTFTGNTLTGNGSASIRLPAAYVDQLDASSTFAGNGTDFVEVAADYIVSDAEWQALDVDYQIQGDVYVQDSARPTLVLDDGVSLYFDAGTSLYVGSGNYGSLETWGSTAGVLMSAADPSPRAGDWDGLYVGYYAYSVYLQGLTLEYGGGNGYGCLFSYYSDPEINGVTAQSCDNAGFYVYSGSYPLVYDSTFQDNAIYGVYVLDSAGLDSSGGPTFMGNTLTGNGSASIRLPANYVGQLDSTSSFAGNGTDWIEVAADYVTTDATWQALDTDYEVMSDLYVQDSTSPLLTLEPGVLIGFDSGADLFVGTGNYGGLDATGTAAAPITFTSSDLVSPTQGDWGGIYLGYYAVDSVTTLDYTTVEYGGSNGYGDVFLYYCDGSVTNSSMTDSSSCGIYRLGSSPTISGITYTNNASGDLC